MRVKIHFASEIRNAFFNMRFLIDLQDITLSKLSQAAYEIDPRAVGEK